MSTNPINLSPNLAGVLYFGVFYKKLYLLYIGTEGVFISIRIKPGLDKNNMFWRTEQSDLVKLTILVLMLMDGKNRVSSSVG
jgi:hypothetical protein